MPYWRLYYHVVWSTKNREPTIDESAMAIIARSIKSTINNMESIPHAIGGVENHMHVALSIPPTVRISDVVARMKGASSHAVNANNAESGFRWQTEYGILSFGPKALQTVIEYVGHQRERHSEHRLWAPLERISEFDASFVNSPERGFMKEESVSYDLDLAILEDY